MKHLRFSCIHLLTVAALVFTSCSDDDDPKPISNNDVKAPTVVFGKTSVKANKKVAQEGKFSVEAILEDDVALASWAIDVDPVKGADDTDAVVATKKEKWKDAIKDLKGSATKSKEEIKRNITVPADADLGKYTVTFSAKDKAGNEGKETVVIEVVTKGTDTTDPTITVNEGGVKNDDKVKIESTFSFKLTFKDEIELASWNIVLNDETKKAEWGTALDGLSGTIGESDENKREKTFSKDVTVPNTVKVGKYTFSITAKDKAGNEGKETLTIEVVAS